MGRVDKLLSLIRDFNKFSKEFLSIRTKAGGVERFKLNSAQQYLHERLEAQLKATGKVRAVILKGRQAGCSTYIQARFFHKVATQKGKKAFILTHEAEATKNLFDMTKRFSEYVPDGVLPKIDASSAKELKFNLLDSGYSVGTAGNKGVGRSQTVQLFHGSETAYWPHAEEHAKGILQAVSDEAGTEVILESTANGMGNYFHSMWKSAESGQSDFQAIFIPWFWQKEYTRPLANDFRLFDDEEILLTQYAKHGMTKEHLAWRRNKLKDFSNDHDTAVELFNVEYPNCAKDAFRNPVEDRFISNDLVIKAMQSEVTTDAPLLIGVDPAISERDRLAIIRRRGRLAFNLETKYGYNTMEIAGLIKNIIETEKPFKVFIDSIGVGAGVVDRLHEMGYTDTVEGINVARSANLKDKFRNLRAELWHEMREWLSQDMPVQIPDTEEMLSDLTSLGYKYDSSARLQIESKDDLKARGMPSPDCGDALALTFALGSVAVHTKPVQHVYNRNNSGLLI